MSVPATDLPPSGPPPGEHLAAFIVDDVTGAFPGERLCYVCHYGDGSVVLVFVRGVAQGLAALGRALDAWIAAHPGSRAVVVVVSADPEGDAEELREVATEHGLRLPLTIASEGEFGPHLYRLHPRVPVTAVLYREKTVVRNLTARDLSPEFLARLRAAADALTLSTIG